MNFATNYDDLGSSEMLPEGKYECIIKSAEEKSLGGYPVLDIRCVIRNDVEQKYKDRFIFHKIWKKKEPSPQDQQVDGYSFKQLMNLAAAAKISSACLFFCYNISAVGKHAFSSANQISRAGNWYGAHSRCAALHPADMGRIG
jgi:hypothetical protein